MTEEMPKTYDSRLTEQRWYEFWESSGFFTAVNDPNDTRPTYTIAIPPPNVTGSLHMGHACRTTFEDVLIRFERMRGKNTLWIPGTDHAGIATQVVVERQLKAEGKTRHDLGREKFVERVWKWKEESGGRILKQLRHLGASCDWTRERFTMEPALSRAVREKFVRLFEEGLIYRATRLVNWDVESQTVLSDLEVEAEENVEGELFDFAYPVEGGGEVVVSTTRPETMLGDTAVAIHPDDQRYTHLHGKFVLHPFVDRRIPVVCDPILVDMAFGTGVVKVTPAHDWNDFQTGKRHQLEEVNILNLDGTINASGGEFAGLDRFKARKAVKKALEDRGLARGSKKHLMTLPRSQRSGTIVEPIISTQWWVKMQPLAEPAITAVESGRITLVPAEWDKTYFHWMRNIQDWCISRQLWWGHSIPAFYCKGCEHMMVTREDPGACEKCGGNELVQDQDVLDTWFSSSLWPFSTLGWPEQTADLRKFYPTNDMETGYDILFFWVARMIMMGLHFMGDVPFKRVLLSGLVTDEHGEKMSKVKGNVIDPLDVIYGATVDELVAKQGGPGSKGAAYIQKTYPDGFHQNGADALRMTLLSFSPQTRKMALSIKRVEGYRNFANKLWNASRFALMNLEGSDAAATGTPPEAALLPNRWILSRLSAAIDVAVRGLEEYRLDESTQALYHFVWDELCDWYLELTKTLMQDPASAAETRATLVHVLETTLRALHPMMPFITEEIWQRIPKTGAGKTIVLARYPSAADGRRDDAAERDLAILQAAIVAARTIRAEHELAPRQEIPLVLLTNDAAARAVLEQETASIATLCRASVRIDADDGRTPDETAVSVADKVRVLVPLAGLVDFDKERERLARELKKVSSDLAVVEKKLANEGFVARAPEAVVAQERARQRELTGKREHLATALSKLAP
jgi:valyl-tRNA synthetase